MCAADEVLGCGDCREVAANDACGTLAPAFPCSSLTKTVYCVAVLFLIGLPFLSVLFRSWVTLRSRSYAVVRFEM